MGKCNYTKREVRLYCWQDCFRNSTDECNANANVLLYLRKVFNVVKQGMNRSELIDLSFKKNIAIDRQ